MSLRSRRLTSQSNKPRGGALPCEVEWWSLTSLREKVVQIGARVIAHVRYVIFQIAEVAVPRELFGLSSTGSRGCDRRTLLCADEEGQPLTGRSGTEGQGALGAFTGVGQYRRAAREDLRRPPPAR